MRPTDEERGQSVQIGAVLLFGFLVLALSGYQAVTVPQQNERVELNHLERVNGDVIELRNDLLEAAATGRHRTVGVELGTRYPARTFGVNPAPPGGSLRSTTLGGGEYVLDATGLNLEDVCGFSREGDGTYDVPSDALVYSPSYSEAQNPPDVVYENSVVYRAYPTANRLDSGQTLIDGRTISLTLLAADYAESGSDTVSVDLEAGETGVGTTKSTGVTLTVPTALSASEWETLLADELSTNGGQVTDVRDVSGGVEVELATAEYTVTCAVVGTGSAPETSPDQVLGEDGGGGDINPADGGVVKLADAERDPGDTDRLVLTFVNTGESVNLSSARFSFYFDNNGDGPSTVDVRNFSAGTMLVDDLEVTGASAEPATRQAFLGEGNTTTLRLDFDSGSFKPKDGDFVVIRLAFGDGDRSNFFVDVPAQSDTFGNDRPSPEFTYSPPSPSVGESVTFDASGSSDPDGSISTYEWDWDGDGSYEASTASATTTHAYGSSGSYTVGLRVTDSAGATNTTTGTVSVSSGGGTTPTVDSLATSAAPGNKYDASYSVSDSDGDLVNVTLVLEEADGTVIDSMTDYSGPGTGSASNSGVTLRYGGSDSPARVRLVAEDAAGNRVEDTEPVP